MNKEKQKELLKEIMDADAKYGLYHIGDTNKMVTAVEWLGYELNTKLFYNISDELWIEVYKIFEQAKSMEKEQIKESYELGWVNGDLKKSPRFGEDYYNVKFNNQTNQ